MGIDRTSEEWLDFVIDTLKQLDESVQGAFLQEFLLRLVNLEASAKESIALWDGVLANQRQLIEKLGRSVTLRTAAVDYFGELRLLRNPILIEYDELRQLRHNAATDPLTGLNNRRIFDEYLLREINRATRYRTTFALLAFDLHEFKGVNDTYGHSTGDEILRSVARAILEAIRGSDIACRTGGDEFTILLPQTERGSAQVLAERIARKFKEYAESIAPNTSVAMDYGIAIFPEDGHDAPTLFAFADKMLYASKHLAHFQEAPPPQSPDEGLLQSEPSTPDAEAERDGADGVSGLISLPADEPAKQREAGARDYALDGRKFKRIRLEGTPALGIVRVGAKCKTVRILDLSRGGVCLVVDQADLPENFPARIQVPLMPGGELTLHRVYSLPLKEGKRRVGCSFAPVAESVTA